jgi:hypothetical protein
MARVVHWELSRPAHGRAGGTGVHLYQGTSEHFIADAVQARLANHLADRFFDEFRYRPAPQQHEELLLDPYTEAAQPGSSVEFGRVIESLSNLRFCRWLASAKSD